MVDDNKPSLEDVLAHHGVKGMKWGHRKAVTGREVRLARAKRNEDNTDLQFQRLKTAASIGRSSHASNKAKLNKMKLAYLKSPDRATAARLTHGEKAALLILTASSGGTVGLAAIGASSLASRHIEKKQARGGYDKK